MYNNHSIEKQIVLLLCAMRSGSTLLKALLAEAPDISNIPEVALDTYTLPTHLETVYQLSDKRIILLKRPPALSDILSYPWLPPFENMKIIVLVRDIYSTVQSIKKMLHITQKELTPYWTDYEITEYYYCKIYSRILSNSNILGDQNHTLFVRYEDLLREPLKITKELFAFLGSIQEKGVDSYHQPENYQWRWGIDDGGEKIKSLRIDQEQLEGSRTDLELANTIEKSAKAQLLRKIFGYC